jgi:hypothetical protein
MATQVQNIAPTAALANTNLLRRAIQADGIFEIVFGLGLTIMAAKVAEALGFAGNGVAIGALVATGIALIAVGGGMLIFARKEPVDLRFGLTLAAINDVSAIGLVAILLLGLLPVTIGGAWLLGVTAAALFFFAIIEYAGWWQARRA